MLFFIDALNETKDNDYWQNNIKSFIYDFNQFNNIKIGFSCRTSYLEKVFPEDILKKIIQVEHDGFEDIEYEASLEFFDYYQIEKPTFPLMSSEFANPLFLRLFCETIQNDQSKISQDYLSITKLIEAFLEKKNKEICRKIGHVLEREHLVQKSMRVLAAKSFEKNENYLKWNEAIELLFDLVQDRRTSILLFAELVNENLLREDRNDANQDIILFSFERFFEHLVAENLIINLNKSLDVKKEFSNGGKLFKLIANKTAYEKSFGIIEALSILVAEKFKNELFELTNYSNFVIKPSLNGMNWRSSESFFSSSQSLILHHCLRNANFVETGWITLVQLATRERCLINSYFLTKILLPVTLADRDLTWSNFLFDRYKKEPNITRTVNFALKHNYANISSETALLWALILVWFLSSNDRRLRDNSTRALINIIESKPEISLLLLDKFSAVNDDYILERMLLAVYGAFIRNPIQNIISEFVNKTYQLFILIELGACLML